MARRSESPPPERPSIGLVRCRVCGSRKPYDDFALILSSPSNKPSRVCEECHHQKESPA